MPEKPTYKELEQRVLELEKSDLKRKKAEDALRESEERFRRFFMNAPLPYQSLDENGNIIEVNSIFLEILGYSIDEVIGKNFGDFLHPDYVAHFKENFPRFKAVGEVLGVEFEMVKKDGSIVLVSFNGKIQRDDQSRFLRTHCIFQDITERKIAESNLQATLNRFYMMLTNMPAGILLVSEDDRVEFCNQSFCNIFNLEESPEVLRGLTSGEMLERIRSAYSNPEQAVDRITEIISRMELVKDEVVPMCSGFTVLRDFVPLRLDGIYFSRLWIHKDITARKQAEEKAIQLHEAVVQEKDRLSALVNSISDEIWLANVDGIFTLVNPSGSQEFALGSSGAIDVREFAASLEVLRPDGSPRPIEESPALRALRGEIVRNQEEIIRTPAAGEFRYRQVNSTPIRDPKGNIIGSVSVVRDITDSKHTQDALLKSERKLSLVLENMSEGLMVFDADGNVTYQNPASERIHGFQLSEAERIEYLSLPVVWKGWDEQGRPLNFDEWPVSRVIRGEHFQGQVLRARRDDTGHEFFASYNGCPVHDDNGKIAFAFITSHDITERKQAEAQLKDLLSEKEVLLKEVHHRVKNNLQIILSLISLQSDNLTDERTQWVLSDAGARIRTIALVHEMLYKTENLSQLDFAVYATDLLQYLWRTGSADDKKVSLNLSLAPLLLPIDLAVNCGLILNELATNALKHAFPNDRAGDVAVVIEHDSATGDACLIVSDNGIGLPVDFDWRQSNSLGLDIVQMLAGQIRASVQTGPGPGTEFRIKFNVNGIPS